MYLMGHFVQINNLALTDKKSTFFEYLELLLKVGNIMFSVVFQFTDANVIKLRCVG